MADYNDIRYNVGYTKAGNLVFIKKLTASSSSTLSFVDGTSDVVLDGTYDEYLFVFNNIHPATDNTHITFNLSIDSGSNYNVTKTTSNFAAYANEGDSNTSLGYESGHDLAQGTGVQNLLNEIGNDNDQSTSGYLYLFNPSDTTFVKHFLCTTIGVSHHDYQRTMYVAGYGNTTSAVDAVQFSMSSGNIDAGTISLYGIGS